MTRSSSIIHLSVVADVVMATAGAPGSAGSRLAALPVGDNEAVTKTNRRIVGQLPCLVLSTQSTSLQMFGFVLSLAIHLSMR